MNEPVVEIKEIINGKLCSYTMLHDGRLHSNNIKTPAYTYDERVYLMAEYGIIKVAIWSAYIYVGNQHISCVCNENLYSITLKSRFYMEKVTYIPSTWICVYYNKLISKNVHGNYYANYLALMPQNNHKLPNWNYNIMVAMMLCGSIPYVVIYNTMNNMTRVYCGNAFYESNVHLREDLIVILASNNIQAITNEVYKPLAVDDNIITISIRTGVKSSITMSYNNPAFN